MEEKTLEEIQNKFDSLPEHLRLAIIVINIGEKIHTIGRENGLNIKQINELLLKTQGVVFGFVHPDKLEDSIKEIPDIPPQSVKSIERDINEQILKDIKYELIELAEKEIEKEEHKKNTEILKSAGIEILSSNTPLEIEGKKEPTEIPAPKVQA